MSRTTATSEDRRSLSLAGAGVEVREGDDGAKRFFGHAAVFDQRTAIGNPLTWGFYEEIAPGAFTKTLSEQDVRKLIDHDSYYVVSRMSAGTLELAEDNTGLAVDSALDTGLSYVADLIRNLEIKNITGMSFGFYVIKDDWWSEDVELEGGYLAQVEVRRLLEVKLIEVSSVTFPAFPQTDAGLRSGRPDRMHADDEVRAVGLALGRRPDGAALLEARSAMCPDLGAFRDSGGMTDAGRTPAQQQQEASPEPGESTRGDEHDQPNRDEEPAETTPVLRRQLARRRLDARRSRRVTSSA